jgi:4-aminobutyrate aminotransferase-like enzyme
VRGVGALQGIVMEEGAALAVSARAMQQGVLVLAEGDALQVLAVTPPLVISDTQLDAALDVLERGLEPVAP